jgi:hypothetical protein
MSPQALTLELRTVEEKLKEVYGALDRLPLQTPQYRRLDLETDLFSLVNYAQLLRDLLAT